MPYRRCKTKKPLKMFYPQKWPGNPLVSGLVQSHSGRSSCRISGRSIPIPKASNLLAKSPQTRDRMKGEEIRQPKKKRVVGGTQAKTRLGRSPIEFVLDPCSCCRKQTMWQELKIKRSKNQCMFSRHGCAYCTVLGLVEKYRMEVTGKWIPILVFQFRNGHDWLALAEPFEPSPSPMVFRPGTCCSQIAITTKASSLWFHGNRISTVNWGTPELLDAAMSLNFRWSRCLLGSFWDVSLEGVVAFGTGRWVQASLLGPPSTKLLGFWPIPPWFTSKDNCLVMTF